MLIRQCSFSFFKTD